MRGWLILSGIIILAIILPIFARTSEVWWIHWIGTFVLTLAVGAVMVGTGLFGYICIRAQARKWGAGLIVAAVLCLLVIFWLWTGHFLIFVL